jgi:quinol-cytochrome oxidoreductase complex cytochrome b subunit
LARILSLHFLLGLLAIAIALVHLNLIHRVRPSSSNSISDNYYLLSDVTLKDFIILIPVLWLLSTYNLSLLIHPDN